MKARVRAGGHSIPVGVIRRRYARSAANFWHLYRPLAASWQIVNNSAREPEAVATGDGTGAPIILSPRTYAAFMELIDASPHSRADSTLDA